MYFYIAENIIILKSFMLKFGFLKFFVANFHEARTR